jgi:hypothetical protein
VRYLDINIFIQKKILLYYVDLATRECILKKILEKLYIIVEVYINYLNIMLSIKPMATILKEKIFENARFYNGKPSVTTVLKIINDPGMEKIKLMKGEEARDKLMEYKA